MNHPTKNYANPAVSPSGAAYVVGTITNILGNVAEVRLHTGDQVIHVRTDMVRAKGVAPKAGEDWIFDQPFGSWMFAMPIGWVGIDAPPSWTPATLLGAWVDFSAPGPWTAGSGLYSPASYWKDASGLVHLSGVVKSGTVTASSVAGPISADVLQLPAGYRISSRGQMLFSTYGSVAGAVLVMPDGYVRAYAGSATQLSLDAVRFLAEQ